MSIHLGIFPADEDTHRKILSEKENLLDILNKHTIDGSVLKDGRTIANYEPRAFNPRIDIALWSKGEDLSLADIRSAAKINYNLKFNVKNGVLSTAETCPAEKEIEEYLGALL